MPETTVPLSLADAAARLLVGPDMFQALLGSGLLGPVVDRMVTQAAVESFARYGTQWQPGLPPRTLGRDPFQEFTASTESELGVRPTLAMTGIQIAGVDPEMVSPEDDTGWIAQFYLKPNPYFFADPGSMALIGPVLLKLTAPTKVADAELSTWLFPDPSGALAMVAVIAQRTAREGAMETAYDIASPVLDELSARYDIPLPVAQTIVIGIPSGVIELRLPQPPRVHTIAAGDIVRPRTPRIELVDAVALYREAVSSSNPFHRFLTFWRVYENVLYVRRGWAKRTRQPTSKTVPEKFPDETAFGTFARVSFDQAKQRLNASHRVALAHGDVASGRPRTGALSEDYFTVANSVPVIAFMPRTVLTNLPQRPLRAPHANRHSVDGGGRSLRGVEGHGRRCARGFARRRSPEWQDDHRPSPAPADGHRAGHGAIAPTLLPRGRRGAAVRAARGPTRAPARRRRTRLRDADPNEGTRS